MRTGEFESKCKEYLEPEVEPEVESNALASDKVDKYFVVTFRESVPKDRAYHGPFDHDSAKTFAMAQKRGAGSGIFVGITKLISEVKLSVEITDY